MWPSICASSVLSQCRLSHQYQPATTNAARSATKSRDFALGLRWNRLRPVSSTLPFSVSAGSVALGLTSFCSVLVGLISSSPVTWVAEDWAVFADCLEALPVGPREQRRTAAGPGSRLNTV